VPHTWACLLPAPERPADAGSGVQARCRSLWCRHPVTAGSASASRASHPRVPQRRRAQLVHTEPAAAAPRCWPGQAPTPAPTHLEQLRRNQVLTSCPVPVSTSARHAPRGCFGAGARVAGRDGAST
jgi:hypothetical protein